MKIVKSSWSLNFDVNRDGLLNIGDIGEALYRAFFFPGDQLIGPLQESTSGVLFSAALSLAFWIFVLCVFRSMLAFRAAAKE
jgi:hypothetical protein